MPVQQAWRMTADAVPSPGPRPAEDALDAALIALCGSRTQSVAAGGEIVGQGEPADRVYRVLHRWFTEGLPDLEDQSRAPQEPARKVDLKALAAIRRLQANPELVGFRVSAALEQQGIFLSPRTCRRILALHR